MATLAAAVSPLSPAETSAQINRLRDASGDTTPADREEIDGFLTEQAANAEVCDSLNPRRRATIVGRFRDAIGRLRIDRATLNAWKTAAAQAWAKVGHRAGALMLVVAVAAGAGGCGTGGGEHVPEPTTTSSAVVSQVQEFTSDPTPTVAVPGEVATYFGSQAKAQHAYKQAATAFMTEQMDSNLLDLDRKAAKPDDFPIRKSLTSGARLRFDDKVTQGAHDDQAFRDATALSRYGVVSQIAPATLTPGVKTGVVQKRAEKPRYSMGSDSRPKVTFESRGAVRTTEDGARTLSPYATLTTLWLTKDGHIDGWASDWTKVDPGPDFPDRW